MLRFLDFISSQPKGYVTSLADLQGLTYGTIYAAISELRKKGTLSPYKQLMLVHGVSKAEGKEYKVEDFIW